MARRIPLERPPTKGELAKLEQQEKVFRAIVGANIRKTRIAAGLTQLQLSVRADISLTYIGQAERGLRGVTIDFLARVGYALNVPPSSFLIPS